MRFEQAIIGFMLITVFTIGAVVMIGDMQSSYEDIGVNMSRSDAEDYWDPVFNTTNDIYNLSESLYNSTLSANTEGGVESWESMTSGSYSAVRMVTKTTEFFKNMGMAIALALKIDPVFVTIGWTIFVVILIFSAIYMVFRFIPR